ncbi:helix-turn-helix domain-containing protein [Xanthobacter autotrophicus DSM 597]|uniref:TetR/AcrR family transcriptional regulator n=1 Tax=Xanthobacter TaxID=279 RepID=UPI001AE7B70C|nr:TetR/AcrR family transcriptional regulator [Xanthobacter flavus]MBP2148145.1 AcrR family transcriptional regulator [Xanthobacter flavus]
MRDAAASRPDHKQEQRKRILDAAVVCFGRDGFHGASMQKICAEAGMSPGALYRYFPSKESLIAAIVEGERAERLGMFDMITKAPSVLGGMVACLRILFTERNIATARLGPEIQAEAIRNADLRKAIEPCEAETSILLADALAAAERQGEIDPALDPDLVAMMLQVVGDGLLLHHQLHPEWQLEDRLPEIEAMVRRMLSPAQPKAVPE